jgi:hypothetical protein
VQINKKSKKSSAILSEISHLNVSPLKVLLAGLASPKNHNCPGDLDQ